MTPINFLSSNLPIHPVATAPVTLETAARSTQKNASAQLVDQWLNRDCHPQLPHATIFAHCQNLTAEENCEMLSYALELMKDKREHLNNHIRLLWIIQDNLGELIKFDSNSSSLSDPTKFLVGCAKGLLGNAFNPQFEFIEGLALLKRAIQEEKNPSINLKAIQENLFEWEKAFKAICTELAPCILTSQDPSLYPTSSQVAMPALTSYLLRNKTMLKVTLEEQTMFLFSLSPTELSLFSLQRFATYEKTLGAVPLDVCSLDSLPDQCQEELNSASSTLIAIIQQENSLFADIETQTFTPTIQPQQSEEMRQAIESLSPLLHNLTEEEIQKLMERLLPIFNKLPEDKIQKLIEMQEKINSGDLIAVWQEFLQLTSSCQEHLNTEDVKIIKQEFISLILNSFSLSNLLRSFFPW